MSGSNESNHEELIRSFKDAVDKGVKVRRTIAGLLAAVVIVNVTIICMSVKDFATSGVPVLNATLAKELTPILNAHSDQVGDTLTRTYSTYVNAFQKTFDRDYGKIEQLVHSEGELLEKYAQTRWPEFQRAIGTIAVEQESVLKAELEKVVGGDGVRY